MTPSEQFLSEIDAFLQRTGMKASAFGRESIKDPNLVGDLRNGRSPSLALVGRVHEYIRSHKADAA